MWWFVEYPFTGHLFDAFRASFPRCPSPFLRSRIIQAVHQCLLPFDMAINNDVRTPPSVKCFVDKLLELGRQCRILQAVFFIYLVEPRCKKWMFEDRFACYSLNVQLRALWIWGGSRARRGKMIDEPKNYGDQVMRKFLPPSWERFYSQHKFWIKI